MTAPKHPDIEVRLSETDGNAFAILAAVRRALHRAGIAEDECQTFMAEAQAGNYDHLLRTCMAWVDVR